MATVTRTAKKVSIVVISKKKEQHCTYSTLVHFLAVVLNDYNVKLPNYTLYGGTVVCAPVRPFYYRSFSPWWPLAFFSSHRRYKNFIFV